MTGALEMPQATVKAYDSVTRTGKLVTDDGKTEYAVDPEAMDSGMFRFLRPGQRVTFDLVDEAGEQRLRNLRIGLA
jgi:cold shock CspA family protein